MIAVPSRAAPLLTTTPTQVAEINAQLALIKDKDQPPVDSLPSCAEKGLLTLVRRSLTLSPQLQRRSMAKEDCLLATVYSF